MKMQEEPATFVWKSGGAAEEEWEDEQQHCGEAKEDSEQFAISLSPEEINICSALLINVLKTPSKKNTIN